jgi:hypothetical protein
MEADLEKDHEFREYFTPTPEDLRVKKDVLNPFDHLNKDGQFCCPKCDTELEYFSGLERMPAGLFCSNKECGNNALYEVNTMKVIGRMFD